MAADKPGNSLPIWKPHPGPQTLALSIDIFEMLVGGARGGGKGQPLDAEVLTPWGFRKMGTLKIGSAICNPDGSVCKVIGIYPLGHRQIYKVSFTDGSSCEVTDDHLWLAWRSNKTTKSKGKRISGEMSAKIWKTSDMIPLVGGKQRFHIPALKAVAFNDIARTHPRPVPAYSLGTLLGDGAIGKKSVVLSCTDQEIVDRVMSEIPGVTKNWYPPRCPSYWIPRKSDMVKYLEKVGLSGSKAHEKFIPQEYLTGSPEQRWHLLQGLMDTDGWADMDGDIYFSTSSPKLRDDMVWLCRSLGGIVTVRVKTPTYRNSAGEKKTGRPAWALRIKFRNPSKAFFLKRKAILARAPGSMGRIIESIEPTRISEAQCIQVNHPNGLYITNDFIVTHNTECQIVWMAIPACGPKADGRYRGLVIRENYQDLLQWIDRARGFYEPYGAQWKASERFFIWPNGAKVQLGHMQDQTAFKHYQGLEFHRLGWEELTHCEQEILYEKVLASVRSSIPSLMPAVFATANPGGPGHNWVKKRFIQTGSPNEPFWDSKTKTWRVFIPATVEDNPSVTQEYRNRLEGLSDEHLRRAWRYGDWDVLEGQYFPEWDYSKHTCDPFDIPLNWEIHLGMDPGYSPDPFAVLYFAMAPNGRVVLWKEEYYTETIPEKIVQSVLRSGRRPETAVAGPDLWARRNSPNSSADEMIRSGLWMLRKGDNHRREGWMRLHEYLQRRIEGRPALQVFRTCRRFIEDLPQMIHNPDYPADALKNSLIDHGPDACRYFLMSKPLPPEEPDAQAHPSNDRTERAKKYLQELQRKAHEKELRRYW